MELIINFYSKWKKITPTSNKLKNHFSSQSLAFSAFVESFRIWDGEKTELQPGAYTKIKSKFLTISIGLSRLTKSHPLFNVQNSPRCKFSYSITHSSKLMLLRIPIDSDSPMFAFAKNIQSSNSHKQMYKMYGQICFNPNKAINIIATSRHKNQTILSGQEQND